MLIKNVNWGTVVQKDLTHVFGCAYGSCVDPSFHPKRSVGPYDYWSKPGEKAYWVRRFGMGSGFERNHDFPRDLGTEYTPMYVMNRHMRKRGYGNVMNRFQVARAFPRAKI